MNRLREWSSGEVRDLNMTVVKAAANPDARYKVRQAQLFSADLDDAIGGGAERLHSVDKTLQHL